MTPIRKKKKVMRKKLVEKKLLALIEMKNFDELTLGERKFVLAEMGKEEFTQLRNLHKASKSALGETGLPQTTSLKAHLDEAYQAKYGSRTLIKNLLDSKIELWKVAATFLFLFISLSLFVQHAHLSQESDGTVVYKIDTVFKEIPVENLLAMNDSAGHYPDTPASFSNYIPGTFPVSNSINFKQEDLRIVNSGGFPANAPQYSIFKEKNIQKPDWNEILQSMPLNKSLRNKGDRKVNIY